MQHLKERRIQYLIAIIFVVIILLLDKLLLENKQQKTRVIATQTYTANVPAINELTASEHDELVRYGKILIDSTSHYFGPRGAIATTANGMDCQNCHLESGTKFYSNNFLAVASTYPKFRERSGKIESVERRVNGCMQRSLNGEPIDSLSKEMKAMVAYIKWTGKYIHNKQAEGAGNKELPFLARAADALKGKAIYAVKCNSCHGANGSGLRTADGKGYVYPPLCGEHSYTVSAGMFRLSKLASFIKYNMPLGANYKQPVLNNEDAWDVAAYVNSLPHPEKMFATDWPVVSTKPVDYPFGPYADGFSEKQHKYGPFDPIKKAKDLAMKK